jgi:c-type cytochrome biogenesis protein CcmF
MLTDLGHLAVWFALAACLYAVVISVFGHQRNDDRLVQSGRLALTLTLPLVLIGCIGLWVALFTHDFGVRYVAQVSSNATPDIYRFTALWGSQNGSLLFWCLIMTLFVATVMLRNWRDDKALLPWVTVVCAVVLGFFLCIQLFLTNAFVRYDFPPADGNGLNPLLRHPGMIIHPPMLYAGYTGLLPSFAFLLASLITRRTDNVWLTASRRWTLVGWVFLTAGLALGGRWAHDVLGWGGYWGWDPSENMPLITWLFCTAFLHSQMIQEKRGMFKNWNVLLMLLTFASMFFGTAFIRSGLLTSVHAFAASDIGPWFMGAMAVILIVSVGLWLTRLDTLKSEHKLESGFSREGIFLLQNVLFVSTGLTVFIGTVFPILTDGLTGSRITVGPPFFDQVAGPQMMLLVVLMGIAPLMAWARASIKAVGRQSWKALAIAALALGVMILAGWTRDTNAETRDDVRAIASRLTPSPERSTPLSVCQTNDCLIDKGDIALALNRGESAEAILAQYAAKYGTQQIPAVAANASVPLSTWLNRIVPVLAIFLCLYSLVQTLFEYGRGVAARVRQRQESAPLALARLFEKNQRRYGGYFVHLGVVLIAIGALGKGYFGFDTIRNVPLNGSFAIGDYRFTYRGIYPVPCEFDDCQTTQAALRVENAAGTVLGGVFPHRDVYPRQQHTATIADVTGPFHEEVYVLLGAWEGAGETASFHVYINPFINWIWVGSIVMCLGFVLAFWRPATEPASQPAPARRAVPAK